MGSGYKLFQAGAVLTASDLNAYCQEQSVMYFANIAARDTALTGNALTDGMVCYIGSNDANEGLYTYNGTAWRKGPGWNAPWGTVGVSKITSNATQSTTRGDTGLTITTATIPSNRHLKHTITGMTLQGSVNDMARYSIFTGTSGGSSIFQADYFAVSTANAYTISFSFYETTSSTAALSRRVTQERSVGSSSWVQLFCDAARPATYIIEDIGPAGAPV